MPTYRWKPNADTITYELERSVDVGLNWTPIASIPHDDTGPNYDSSIAKFFYIDAAPVVGEIVRIRADNVSGSSPYALLIAPPSPATTTVLFGVIVLATLGDPCAGVPVRVRVCDERSSTFVPSGGDSSVPSINKEPLFGLKRDETVFTDETGRFQINLVRGVPVLVEIPSVKYQLPFRVPLDRDVLNLRDAYVHRLSNVRVDGQVYAYQGGAGFEL